MKIKNEYPHIHPDILNRRAVSNIIPFSFRQRPLQDGCVRIVRNAVKKTDVLGERNKRYSASNEFRLFPP